MGLVHAVALAFWGGVVAVEIVIEAAGWTGRLDPRAVALLHRWTDRYVEIPALVAVVVSGLVLFARADWSLALAPKVALGLGAVLANAVCVVLVERRAAGSDPARGARRIAATALVGVPLAAAALYLGGGNAGWW